MNRRIIFAFGLIITIVLSVLGYQHWVNSQHRVRINITKYDFHKGYFEMAGYVEDIGQKPIKSKPDVIVKVLDNQSKLLVERNSHLLTRTVDDTDIPISAIGGFEFMIPIKGDYGFVNWELRAEDISAEVVNKTNSQSSQAN